MNPTKGSYNPHEVGTIKYNENYNIYSRKESKQKSKDG